MSRQMKTFLKITILVCAALMADCSFANPGFWSRDAIRLALKPGEPARKAWAPNKKMYVSEDDQGVYLKEGERVIYFDAPFTPNLVEVLWSPDSRFAAITGSDGGAVGTWSILLINSSGKNVSDTLNGALHKRLIGMASCDGDDPVNLVARRWKSKGGVLTVKAEVAPHSNCQNLGKSVTIDVSVTEWKTTS